MTPAAIRFGLDEKDITQRMIAEEESVSNTAVSRVINRDLKSDRLMKAISKKLRKDHRIVFPEHYITKVESKTRAGY